jgi:23S rRNA pseudouridine1911/1915/1917 synthase
MELPSPPAATRFVVPFEHDGARLDVFLAAATQLSRRAARALIGTGDVLRNGQPVRVLSRTVQAGDVIDALRSPAELGAATPLFPLPDILFADGWVLVADKPAGVLSQPADSRRPDDLALDELLLLGLALREGRRPFLRLVHRLDRQTSGAVLFARVPQALPPLSEAWRSGGVDRRYLAVVGGHPSFRETEVDRPIGRDPDHRWRFRVDGGGRPAHTSVGVVEHLAGDATLVECRLRTGRTHQVRVHLASLGHPVVGDALYGGRMEPTVDRPLLHASRLDLPHPKTGDRLVIESPLPPDFSAFVGRS